MIYKLLAKISKTCISSKSKNINKAFLVEYRITKAFGRKKELGLTIMPNLNDDLFSRRKRSISSAMLIPF